MAVDYYVDYDNGDDAWDGTTSTPGAPSGPKQHISAMIEALNDPIDDEVTINLAGTVAAPQTYLETEGKVELKSLNFLMNTSLTIQPEIWNETNYESDDDPYNEGGSWDPTAGKPCIVPPFMIENTKNLTFKGLDFRKSDDNDMMIVSVSNQSDVAFHYCAISQGKWGFVVSYLSNAYAYNCYFYHNDLGVSAAYRSILSLIGANYVTDNLRVGVTAFQSATIVFQAWRNDSLKYITDIRTTTEILKYTAIHLRMNSSIDIEDAWFVDNDIDIAHVRIINETAFRSKQYFGIVVESQSIFSGAENTSFAEATVNDGNDTIPTGQQIVAKTEEGAIAIS